jgi:transposase
VVIRDGVVPVVSRAYPGSKPDVTQFTAVVDESAARYGVLAGDGGGLTVVFDVGNDSAANQDHLAGLGLHFVSSRRCRRPGTRTCSPFPPPGTSPPARTGSPA